MFNAKKALLASASLLIGFATLAAQPSFAQDAEESNLSILQQSLENATDQPADQPAAVQTDNAQNEAPAAEVQPAAEVSEPATTAVVEPASDELPAANDPQLLEKIARLQQAIVLKRLELDLERSQSELDKLTGAAAEREAAIAAAAQGTHVDASGVVTQPQDDPTTLPGVAAIFGAKGEKKVELNVTGGGSITAKAGDMLPGGWKLVRIDGSAVYVQSARTGAEFVLGSAAAPEAAARTTPVAAPQTAPAAPSAPATPSQDGDIILAPAN